MEIRKEIISLENNFDNPVFCRRSTQVLSDMVNGVSTCWTVQVHMYIIVVFLGGVIRNVQREGRGYGPKLACYPRNNPFPLKKNVKKKLKRAIL